MEWGLWMKTDRLISSAKYREVLSYFLRILLPLVFYSLIAFLLYFVVGASYEKQLIRGEQMQQIQLSVRSLPVSYTHLTLPTNREV